MSDPTKQALREQLWAALRAAGAARFPGVEHRIPNFVGAEAAAERLVGALGPVDRVKCNPDSPQRPVRHRLLKAGVVVVVPAPKLAEDLAFIVLDPADLEGQLWRASSIVGAFELGRPVAAEEVGTLDAIVTGCVGAGLDGARLGKGGGYSDLEYAVLRELGAVDEHTPIATSVHPCQVVPAGTSPMAPHDISLDLIATPERAHRVRRRFERPHGVRWQDLDDAKIDAIPLLQRRRP